MSPAYFPPSILIVAVGFGESGVIELSVETTENPAVVLPLLYCSNEGASAVAVTEQLFKVMSVYLPSIPVSPVITPVSYTHLLFRYSSQEIWTFILS